MWGRSDYGGRGRFVDQKISLGTYSRPRDREDIDMYIANVQRFKASRQVASDQSRSTRKARSAWIKIYPVKNHLLQFMDFYRTLYVF